MPDRRKLTFSKVPELYAEVERLRGGYTQLGQWTLPQICFHLRWPMDALKEPKSTEPTEEQKKFHAFLDDVIANGWPKQVIPAAEPMRPEGHDSDAEVDALLKALMRLHEFRGAYVDAFIFGPVPTEKLTKFMLAHAAHHLSFLLPKKEAARRMDVKYADEDAVIADVERLRKGYAQAGSWSLPRMAWHLNAAVQQRMKQGPHPADTAEQIGRKEMLKHVLQMNCYLPQGIKAPDPMQPPADAPESSVDDLIASLKQLKAYKGDIAPHRLFGHIPNAEARRLNLIHCAHHLSYLTPS